MATVPDVVEKLIKLGFTVTVESGAGDAANFSDDAYRAAGARSLATRRLCGLRQTSSSRCAPSSAEVALMREGTTLIDFIWPAQNPDLMQQLSPEEGHGAGHRLPATHFWSRAQKWTRSRPPPGSAAAAP